MWDYGGVVGCAVSVGCIFAGLGSADCACAWGQPPWGTVVSLSWNFFLGIYALVILWARVRARWLSSTVSSRECQPDGTVHCGHEFATRSMKPRYAGDPLSSAQLQARLPVGVPPR